MVVVQPDGRANLVATVSFLIIDSTILLLRLISKRKTQTGVHLDDWFIVAAYLVFAAQSSVIIYGEGGIAKSRNVVAIAGTLDPGLVPDPSTRLRMLKVNSYHRLCGVFTDFLWIGSLHYPLVITMVKLSILSFYLSMFTVEKSFRIAAWIVVCLCVMWGIGTMYLTAFGCKPIVAAYDLTLRLKPTTHCFPYGLIVLVFELSNAILDAIILILPIFIIHILHLPLRKKVLLVLLFWTGGL
ncbi:integral membrane protein [Rutstroemia sp. NJR-2017a BBW]|nr:integral membrane protein [Rutstroemia sp. NJR-2017a BBW]